MNGLAAGLSFGVGVGDAVVEAVTPAFLAVPAVSSPSVPPPLGEQAATSRVRVAKGKMSVFFFTVVLDG
ncbi:hypothetical protein AB0C93_00225 [Streptomyces sp. NPDC048518]|uniref:hypothetical protein n=1 Tax=Streptomyces sp. NPDC048518 TaxID=3155029 RepID=UPI0033E2C09C